MLWDAVQEIIQGPKHTGVNCGKTHKKFAKDPRKHLVMQISESKNKRQDFFLVQNSQKTNKQTNNLWTLGEVIYSFTRSR